MENYYNKFIELLEKEDRYECIKFVKKLLDEKVVDVVELYEKIITPSINKIECKLSEKNICTWQEHIRSGIVRTVIEFCYTYVVEQKKSTKNEKVVVLCPEEEYYDLEARMITDLFSIEGYESIFVGSNTPKSDFLSVIDYIIPKYVIIDVTDYYNIVSAKKYVDSIKEKVRNSIKIYASGSAFKTEENMYKKIGADGYIETYQDIKEIGGI
ncbi:MAG TPA: cobalamin-binding protein [Clostridia bacterium]|jgi:methanogenic corrinoid protein MtbC1|nr:cobalamin-binding protein [Clostridia bacterium]